MKVLGIICSPRKGGNTEILVRQALKGAKEKGTDTEVLHLLDLKIKPCDGCFSCQKTGKCWIHDDMQIVYTKLLESDGIIVGTPVYFWSMTGQAKVMLDRTVPLRYPELKLRGKVGGTITVATRRGCVNTESFFNFFYASSNMIPTVPVDGYAEKKGAIRKDTHAMKSAYELGRMIGALLKEKIEFPKEFNLPLHAYVAKKYGLSQCPIT